MTDRDAQPTWERLDMVKCKLLDLVPKTFYMMRQWPASSVRSPVSAEVHNSLTKQCSLTPPHLHTGGPPSPIPHRFTPAAPLRHL